MSPVSIRSYTHCQVAYFSNINSDSRQRQIIKDSASDSNMGTLYECLREARLEQFYPAFRANGITRSESLITLGSPEFCALGITDEEDRRRLQELVNIIKQVHNSGLSTSPTSQSRCGSSRQNAQSNTSQDNGHSHDDTRSPGYSRHRSQPNTRGTPPSHHFDAVSEVDTRSVLDRVPNFSAASYLDMLQYMPDSSDSEYGTADEEDTLQNRSTNIQRQNTPGATSRSFVGRSVNSVERVKPRPYNYGVHKTPTKSKTNRSSASRALRDEKIKVCVRKRPLTRREQRAKDEDVVKVDSTSALIVNEPKLAVDLKAYTLQHEFIFDEVFHESCSNEDVYTRAARPLISCIFNGGSATCFAYGQTGAGKTHTMLGDAETSGLYLLAGRDIFNIIESGQYGQGLHVWISFFEIYCGQLFDLLNRRNRLHAREDGSGQVCIAGLTETEATNVNSLVQTLEYGNSVRSKGATGVNPDSSRSHAVLQLDIRNSRDIKVGKMSFIDLAGSERASDVTDTDKQTRMEGAEINQSLLALKECIRSIDQDSKHTPFRQSKLTHILKDSFVGNSRTCMIANISPSQTACENTLNTLRYADRVKELKRDSLRSSSVGQAMNLLMNIPPTAPSIFHPSNVLSTSTPMRQQTQSKTRDHRPNMPPETNDVLFDISDTPIRGHNLPRRQNAKNSSSRQQPGPILPHHQEREHAEESVGALPKQSVAIPGPSVRSKNLASSAASQGAASTPPDASPSESDHTDTDSCNATLQNVQFGATGVFQGHIAGVAGSLDTECDFPTSDFNNPEEFNDLNRHQQRGGIHDREAIDGRRGLDKVSQSAIETITTHTNQYSSDRHLPVLKPVTYKSINDDKAGGDNSTDSGKRNTFSSSDVISPTVSQHPPNLHNTSIAKEFFSSDESLDDEELLADGPPSNLSQAMNNLAVPPSQQAKTTQKPSNRDLVNKPLIMPQPAVSSDLTMFTQRPRLHSPKNSIYEVQDSNQAKKTTTNNSQPQPESVVECSHILPSTGDIKSQPVLNENLRDQSPGTLTRSKSSRYQLLNHRSTKSTHDIDFSQCSSTNPPSQIAEDQESPCGFHPSQHSTGAEHSPHPPSSLHPGRHNSQKISDNKELSANESASNDYSNVVRRHSDGSDHKHKGQRHRRATSSPTGEKSDDSSEGIRSSLSDQGQGAYKHKRLVDRANMRKERSDPMIALDLQRKKQTLPDPQSITKMMTRSNTPKSGLSHHRGDVSTGGSWKVVHDQLPSPKSGSDHPQTLYENQTPAFPSPPTPSAAQEFSPSQNATKKSGGSHSEPSSLSHAGSDRSNEASGGGYSLPGYQEHHQITIDEGRIRKLSGDRCAKEDIQQTNADISTHVLYPCHHQPIADFPQYQQGKGDSPGNLLLPNKMGQPPVLTSQGHVWTGQRTEIGGTYPARTSHQSTENIQAPGYFKISNINDGTNSHTGIVTEKLAPGAVFSPIHSYPTTSTIASASKSRGIPAAPSTQLLQQTAGRRNKGETASDQIHRDPYSGAASSVSSSKSEPKATSSLVFQSAPVPVKSGPSLQSGVSSTQEESVEPIQAARSTLISAHEDQLACITSLCKHEMRLLLNAKKAPEKRGFDDYLRRVSDILQQKMAAIASLQGQISLYQGRYPSTSISRSVMSSISASVADIDVTTAAQTNRLQ